VNNEPRWIANDSEFQTLEYLAGQIAEDHTLEAKKMYTGQE
jgi:hypothetical protein